MTLLHVIYYNILYFQNVEETDCKVDSPQLTKIHKIPDACDELKRSDTSRELTQHDDTVDQLKVSSTCSEFSFIATTSTPNKTPPKHDAHETNSVTESVGIVKRKRGRPRKVLTYSVPVDVGATTKSKDDVVSNAATCLRNLRGPTTRRTTSKENIPIGKRTGLRSHISI